MTSDNRNVTRLTAGREEWRKIESGKTTFILRETQSPYQTVAFVFSDATTGIHLGNAIIISETPFGDYEASPWTWTMFAKTNRHDRARTQRTVPRRSGIENPSQFEMYLYEIKPVSDKELLQRLWDK